MGQAKESAVTYEKVMLAAEGVRMGTMAQVFGLLEQRTQMAKFAVECPGNEHYPQVFEDINEKIKLLLAL